MRKILPIISAGLFLAFVICIQMPVDIYINNIDEFSIPLKSLCYTLGISFVILFLMAFLPAIIPYSGFRDRYFAFLAMFAVLCWITANFLFGSYGAFDGRGLSIEPFSVKSIVQASIWIIMLISAIIFCKKIHFVMYQAVTGLLCAVMIFTGFQVINNIDKLNRRQYQSNFMPEDFATFSKHQNIIHIVLDEQQSTVIEHLIETDPSFIQHLSGFIFFPNTTSNYRSTNMAIPAMLTGEVYKNNGDKNQFLDDVLSHNPLTTQLEQSNFSTSIYTMGYYCNKSHIKNCISQPELSPDKSAFLLLDYSLFKAVPDILKPVIYHDDHWIIRRYFVNPSHETTLGGLNHLAFQYFNDQFSVDDINPTYKFYHSMITHSPAVLGKDCELRITKASRRGLIGKTDQAQCAFNHIDSLLENLKKADIYDNSLIIISSDHGSNYLSESQKQNLIQTPISQKHYSTALATLFIKPFHSAGPMRTSNAPVSLNDIPNTILAAMKMPLLNNGKNIIALQETDKRVREFIFYEFDETYWGDSKLPPLTIYTIDGDVRNPQDWILKCSDLGGISCDQ